MRRGFYAFPDYRSKPDIAASFAGRMYKPSYISLHSALSFYGLIPESVVQITSVTFFKTAAFTNAFGEYSYKSVREDLSIPALAEQGRREIAQRLASALG